MGIIEEIFGDSQEAAWRRLADAVSGSYDERFFTGSIVVVKHYQWKITLDLAYFQKMPYTRLRALYFNGDDFHFEMNHIGLDLLLLVGAAEPRIEIGDAAFDAEHIIRGNDKSRVCRLFARQEIRDLVAMHPTLNLGVRPAPGWFWRTPPVTELYAHVPGVVTDLETLKSLLYLHCEVLDQLRGLGINVFRSYSGVAQ